MQTKKECWLLILNLANYREIDKKQYLEIKREWEKAFHTLKKEWEKLKKEYSNKRDYLTSVDFWKKYLEME
mgnify:CR=1 FL=1